MERIVDSAGTRISCTTDGASDGPALLLINSIGSTREMWAPQLPAFARRYRVVRYDARGHGQSAAPAGEYSLEMLGRDAIAILDDVGVDAAHVCGISLGGLTAMWLGIHAADRVRTLVLANTAARIGTVESWTERIALVRERGMRPVADLTMPRWFSAQFRERNPELVERFRQTILSTSPEGYVGCCAALRDADLREEIASIRCPVLAVAGSSDPATAPEGLHFIHRRIRGSKLVTLDTAHLSNVERADEFTNAVLAFVAG